MADPATETTDKELATNVENLSLGQEPKVEKQEVKKSTSFFLLSFIFFLNNDSLEILVDIILHATGSAPILKQKKWAVDQEKPISAIIKFIHKYLKLEPGEKLVSHQTMIVLKILIMIFYSLSVFIHQPNVRPLAGPDHQESVRVLRGKREAGPSLCQESGLGIS